MRLCPQGSTVKGNICKETCTTQSPLQTWFKAGPSNAGAASAVCMLTAQALHAHLGGVPVGAVESCVGGTNVAPWTPPDGGLYVAHIKPLLPMRFLAAIWDQGEADAKRTNTTWYAHEFPKMITGWRASLETPGLPFVYVELCHEDGAEEPKEPDFWEHGQRAALALPATGFATTTDVDKSALHPPDKQDIAPRMALEIRRLAYGEDVVSRGPELVSASLDVGKLAITFTNASMHIGPGVVVPPPEADPHCAAKLSSAVTQVHNGVVAMVPFTLSGNKLVVDCKAGDAAQPVLINGDNAVCFLYGTVSGLPAPPLSLPCASSA